MISSKEQLEEILEEHKPNIDAFEYIGDESFKYLYKNLVENLTEALEEAE